jgi:hypothetical protein
MSVNPVAASRPLPLPEDPRVRAFRHVVALLEASPDIRRLDAIIREASDHDDDREPPKGRVWIRLTPTFGPAEPFCLAGHGGAIYSTPVSVKIEARIPGYTAENGLRLWGAMQRAWQPAHRQAADRLRFRQLLRDNGAADLTLDQPLVPVGDDVAEGRITIDCYA